jgi:hypothetical protein
MREVWEREIGEEEDMRGAGERKKKKPEKTCVVGRGKREKKKKKVIFVKKVKVKNIILMI